MSTFRMPRPADRPERLATAGFTLIELLVALIISALLTGVIFQLMQGQAKFVDIQSGRQEVQQNSRGTLELISSELRATPGSAITIAEANRISFRLPRVWGITCSAMSGGSGYVWVLFPAGTFPTDFPASPSTATDWGLAVPHSSAPNSWRWMTISSIDTGTPACDATVDLSRLGNVVAYRFGYGGLGNPRPVGSTVFVYQTVTYEAGVGSSSTKTWVKRNIGTSAPQVMAGPLTGTSGLTFDYFCENGQMTPPGSNTSGFPKIVSVQVKVAMESTRRTSAGSQIERDSARVALRNSVGGLGC